MPRRKAISGEPKQQTLIRFLPPGYSKNSSVRDDRSRTRPGPSRLPTGVSKAVSSKHEPIELSDQSDTNNGVDRIHFEPTKAIISDDDDDIQPSSPVRRRRTLAKVESHADHGSSMSSDSGEETGPNRRAMSSNKDKPPAPRSPTTEPEPLPKRRRLARGVRPSSPEETDDLLGEVNEADIIQSRFRDRRKQSAFQMKLDQLKKKKLGMKLSESNDEQTSEDDAPIVDSQSDNSDKDGSDHGGDDDGDNIDSFVVQDDGEVIPELPVAFSCRSHQDTVHDFKVVFQLFVHLAMMSMNKRQAYMEEVLNSENYFSVPFQVIRRRISATQDAITSSVWKRDYRKALEQYPDLTLTKLDFAVPHCDACHLGGRQSTIAGWLKGIPYDNLSFEPIVNESDSEDEDSRITNFSLGRFCAARTQLFHRLSHWNYHLYRTLSEEVDLVRQPRRKRPYNRLAYAKNLPPPEDASNPDDIVEWLDRRGIVSAEWEKLRELLDRASNLDTSAGKKEEDVNIDL